MAGDIYLSHTLEGRIKYARRLVERFGAEGNQEQMVYWAMRVITFTNTGCVEALESKVLHENESLMFMDQSGEMNNPANKEKERLLELHLLTDSPLYNDVIALLKKHLNDGVK